MLNICWPTDYKMNPNDAHSIRRHMATLIEYARALRASIHNINENSYNHFITRIGKCLIELLIIYNLNEE